MGILIYLFAFSGIAFAIYQTMDLIKTKRIAKKKHEEQVKKFERLCKDIYGLNIE